MARQHEFFGGPTEVGFEAHIIPLDGQFRLRGVIVVVLLRIVARFELPPRQLGGLFEVGIVLVRLLLFLLVSFCVVFPMAGADCTIS